MQFNSRRLALKTAVAMSSTWLSGCGGSEAEDATASNLATEDATAVKLAKPILTPPPAGVPPGPAGVPLPAGAYRSAQPYLFQSVPSQVIPNRLPDGRAYYWDNYGPTDRFVDYQAGWRWTNRGGDWIDSKLVRQGTSPWFSAPSAGAYGATAVMGYQVDVTLALNHCFSQARWCAFSMVAKNAARAIATPFNLVHAAPFIDVVYKSGAKARLACRMVASNSPSSTTPSTTAVTMSLPVFAEFDRPREAVASASLSYVLTEHWSGSNPTVDGFLLDPPVNSEAPRKGLAATAGRLDENLASQPAVIGVHRYVDGTKLSDFANMEPLNINAEHVYDPAIYGTGPQDLSKLPHAGLGKWINVSSAWSVVPSSFTGQGFKPLSPGLGALRIQMPAGDNVVDGTIVGSAGTLAGNGMIFLPEPLFGKLGRIFVRYYFRLGSPARVLAADRKQVLHMPGASTWTNMAGKFGIAPDHNTSLGGVSGSSGGGYGWQLRHSWYECDAGLGGPDEGAWTPGFHLYDYFYRNPPGHNYGNADGSIADEQWGQRGGSGGALYADRWYCIETELKLNSATNSTGYTADGEIRTWVDGRLAYEKTGMVFRTLPIANVAYNANNLRACRELGVRGLWLNWFHGGKTQSTIDRTIFYTGLAWSKEYIGPSNL